MRMSTLKCIQIKTLVPFILLSESVSPGLTMVASGDYNRMPQKLDLSARFVAMAVELESTFYGHFLT